MKKRGLQVLLMLIFLFVLSLHTMHIYASTNGHSQQNAINWAIEKVNSGWGSPSNTPNYDGTTWMPYDYGEPQCVDLIVAYWDYLLGYHTNGNAADYANKTLPSGWIYTYTPLPGDIAIWTTDSIGHIAIVTQVYNGSFDYVDTNGNLYNQWTDGSGYRHNDPATLRNTSWAGYANVFIHPDFSSGSITPPTTETHTVYFDANGGSVSTSSKTVTKGSAYGDLSTPTKEYYDFTGWFTSAEGGTQITSSTNCNLSSDQTLYAHWTRSILSQGNCGANATYILYADGELIISGNGDLGDYISWHWSYKNKIKKVNIQKGITSIGRDCFFNCQNLTEVSIPESVTGIYSYAFGDCVNLSSVTLSKNIEHIENAPLICDEHGDYTKPVNFRKRYYRILNDAKIETKGLHSLRHTFATNLVNGVKQPDGSIKALSPKQVADLLGHSTLQITEMYYVKKDTTRLNGITDGFEI